MHTPRALCTLLAALALTACASTPPTGMTVTPVPCGDPDYGCSTGITDYSGDYSTTYAYPVLVPVYPIAVAPSPPSPPVKPPSPPPPSPPPPKIRIRPPVEHPCPKGGTSCP